MLYERLEGGDVQCRVCPRLCRIAPGKSGVCRARRNDDGTLYAVTYGRVCSVAADPIEKKPLYHFFPGTTVLSLGSVGCNFTCRHCQNWQIAHADPAEVARDLRELPVRNLPVLADHNDCQGVAWTYNEPTIWLEYILDGAQLAHEHGLYTVMVTNGYITEEALDVLAPAHRRVPRRRQGLQRRPVPGALPHPRHVAGPRGGRARQGASRVPRGDRDQRHPHAQRRRRDARRHRRLDRRVARPGHAVARDPLRARISSSPTCSPTPVATLERAVRIGRDAGLRFVYLGNVPGHEGENTVCPNCRRLLVRRTGRAVEDVALRGTLCAMCGANVHVRTVIK